MMAADLQGAAVVGGDAMSSSAIVASFRSSLTWIWALALIGLFSVGALAGAAQAQSTSAIQAVTLAEPHSQTGTMAAGASTILKTPTATIQPVPLNDAKIGPVAAMSAPRPVANASFVAKSQLDNLEFYTKAQRRIYEQAASLFPGFCHNWEHLLHEREVNNREHLAWHNDGALKTASYTGYGKVESCQCKASKEGLPIGEIKYEEINYSIVGKTIEDAIRSTPKLTHQISTLEIFSWDKGKWFY
jgi:hypothetical protein